MAYCGKSHRRAGPVICVIDPQHLIHLLPSSSAISYPPLLLVSTLHFRHLIWSFLQHNCSQTFRFRRRELSASERRYYILIELRDAITTIVFLVVETPHTCSSLYWNTQPYRRLPFSNFNVYTTQIGEGLSGYPRSVGYFAHTNLLTGTISVRKGLSGLNVCSEEGQKPVE